MSNHVATSTVVPTHPAVAELDRLGDEIAELSAHLDAATVRLLALIREFDARGGWNRGFRSCAEWLAWRVGLEPGAASGSASPGRWAHCRDSPMLSRAGVMKGGRRPRTSLRPGWRRSARSLHSNWRPSVRPGLRRKEGHWLSACRLPCAMSKRASATVWRAA